MIRARRSTRFSALLWRPMSILMSGPPWRKAVPERPPRSKGNDLHMDLKSSPLVSVVTPVYNNAHYLPDCIESILAQTYQNWDYTIVNNCSTDGSMDIARRYAARDGRIRIHDNRQFLRAIPNHNVALHQISPASKYCKMVFADDWVFPECI